MRMMGAPITAWLIDHLDLAPGATVLELASGPGDVGLAVAAALEGTGTVIMSDRAQAMVEAARRAAAARGRRERRDARARRRVARPGRRLRRPRRLPLRLHAGGRSGGRVSRDAPRAPARRAARVRRLGARPPRTSGRRRSGTCSSRAPTCRRRRRAAPACSRSPIPMSSAGSSRRPGSTCARSSRFPVTWSYPDFDSYWRAQSSLNGGLTRLLPTLSASERECAHRRGARRGRALPRRRRLPARRGSRSASRPTHGKLCGRADPPARREGRLRTGGAPAGRPAAGEADRGGVPGRRRAGERRAGDARLHGHFRRPAGVGAVDRHGLPQRGDRDRGADPARIDAPDPGRHLRRPAARPRARRSGGGALGRPRRLRRRCASPAARPTPRRPTSASPTA